MFEADVVSLYQTAVTQNKIQKDPQQLIMAEALNDLRSRLLGRAQRLRWPMRLIMRAPKTPEKGLYIWGGVGTGKTLLMDLFMESLPIKNKLRMHFYRFMQRVHKDLKLHVGQPNPLTAIAKDWSSHAQVICLDEFFVQDIADAMLLGELLKQLFLQGVSLVTTSNVQPDELYKDGLQRARFLPAITCLKANTQVLSINSATDYRLRSLEQAKTYHYPLNAANKDQLTKSWQMLVVGCFNEGERIEVNSRLIQSRASIENAVWFDFQCLCEGPRSQLDYIEISKRFHTVLLSDVPQMDADRDNDARRFISLVDEFYDRRVKLIISAAVPLSDLYKGSKLVFEFDRTQSRLIEMQSRSYLAMAHLG